MSGCCGDCGMYRISGMEEEKGMRLGYSYMSFPYQVLEEGIHTRKAF